MKTMLMICDRIDGRANLLDRAYGLAQLNDAKLHLLDLVYVKGLSQMDKISAAQLKAARDSKIEQRKQELRALLSERGISATKVVLHVIWGKDWVEAVLQLCKSLDPMLVLMNATKKRNQVFHTPTDWQLIERCPSPLLISPMKTYRQTARILVALDLATKVKSKAVLNHRLMASAKNYADKTASELHIVCCVAISPLLADLEIIDKSKYQKSVTEKVKPLLKKITNQYQIPDSCVHFRTGQPHKVINSLAQKLKVNMIVMGAAGRRGVKGRLLGNTAELALQQLYTDLLLERPQ